MAINLKLSSSASGTRNIGPINMGGGPNMVERSLFSSDAPALPYSQWYVPGNGSPAISTSDYYGMNGIYWSLPYDLDTMGSDGATIKAREGGKRYVWVMCGDHPGVSGNFTGGSDFYVGYSNDPQIWPSPDTLKVIYYALTPINVVDQNGYTQNSFYPYQTPFLVYNPDSAGDKFHIYAEGVSSSSSRQHELALITSPDLVTSTLYGPTIPTTTNSGWSSFGQPRRLGVNSWEVYTFGKLDGSAPTPATYRYTSTDGIVWTTTGVQAAFFGPYLTIAGQDSFLSAERGTNDYLAYWPVDASKIVTGGATRISSAFEDANTAYPWQTLLQDVQAYEEDGIASIYISRGYNPADHDRTNKGPYLNNSPHLYDITAGSSGTTLTVTAVPVGVPPLAVGFRFPSQSGRPEIASFGTGTGGVGTYTLNTSFTLAPGSTLTVSTNGGLWHQFIDQYYLITNATTAASAAPLGVKADCVAGVVTISWNNCLPHQNYRVYRGTTVGTQATLIGDVTGTSITDTPTVGSQYFYKVVTMNSGEQKSRIVSVYCSNNTLMVTRHINRVLNDGGSFQSMTSDVAFLASVDSYLTSNDYYKYLLHWVDARFGVKTDGSGFVSKIYCLGTTRLPRGGDYTPTTSNTFPSTSSNTSYSASSFRGTTPSWVNNAASAHGYFGNGRTGTIQRKNEITLIAAYQKPGTFAGSLFGLGQFGGMYLVHNSGSSGNVEFNMSLKIGGGSAYTAATVPFASATAAHVAAGVFDGSSMTAYLDGVAGTPVSTPTFSNPNLLNDTVLRGSYTNTGAGVGAVLASGSTTGMKNVTYTLDNNAAFTGAGLVVFEKGLSSTVIGQITAMYA